MEYNNRRHVVEEGCVSVANLGMTKVRFRSNLKVAKVLAGQEVTVRACSHAAAQAVSVEEA